MLVLFLYSLALLSGGLMVWQWVAALCFPLDSRRPVSPTLPAATILKPVKGIDPGTLEALATWLRQSYPGRWEILLGVESEEDPAAVAIRQLLSAHPGVQGRLLICTERMGVNRKVSTLVQLAREAAGECLVISDADVMAPPDLLAQLVEPLRHPVIGLTHCLYRLSGADNLPSRWESFVVNADFWSQVLQNRSLGPLRYALGAAMAVRRDDLNAIGGFGSLAHVLADDHHLGRRISMLGKRTDLCSVVVDCHVHPTSWLDAWRHQLRWAVTIRVCQPLPHFFSILANGTLWPVLAAAIAPSLPMISTAGLLLILRLVQGLSLEARFTGRPFDLRHAWLPWFKDLLQIPLWTAALLKRHVVWRGHRFRVRRNGHLDPMDPAPPKPSRTAIPSR